MNIHLAPVATIFKTFEKAELGKIVGYIDTVDMALGNIWTDPKIYPPYPQKRMENMFKIISKCIGARIESAFKKGSLWSETFSDVRLKLNECMRICDVWKESMNHLSKIAWKQKMDHQWEGPAFVDRYLEVLMGRMREIFELRSQHDELLKLLTPEEQTSMNIENCFEPLKQNDNSGSFYMSGTLEGAWSQARK